jgi:hypothetical protein
MILGLHVGRFLSFAESTVEFLVILFFALEASVLGHIFGILKPFRPKVVRLKS